MILSNLHTHSTYSDGENSIEEIILKAISLNYESIGFSEHAECTYDIGCPELQLKDQEKYFKLLDSMQKKYPNIKIYKGLELEYFYPHYNGKLDYTIGSVHNFIINEKIYTIDWKIEYLKELIEVMDGPKNFIISYYEKLLNFAKTNNFDIVAHIDLYTKFNEIEELFDIKSSWYLDKMKNSIEELNKLDKLIEINTGAMGKGLRREPYPAINIFKILKDLNSKIIVGADSHSTTTLNYYFVELEKILKKEGINKLYKLSPSGFVPFSI